MRIRGASPLDQYFVVDVDAFIFRTRSSMDLWPRTFAFAACFGGAGAAGAGGASAESTGVDAKAAHGEIGGSARATGSASTCTTGSSQRGPSLTRGGGGVTTGSSGGRFAMARRSP